MRTLARLALNVRFRRKADGALSPARACAHTGTMEAQSKRRGSLFVVFMVAVIVALVLLTQQSLAEMLAGWLASVWVGTMDIVLRLFGAVLPG